MMQKFRKTLQLGSGLYLVALLLATLLYRVVGDSWVLLAIPIAFLPVLFWPLPLVGLQALLERNYWLGFGMLLGCVVWLSYFGGLFRLPKAQATTTPQTLRVLTYNTLGITAAPDVVAAQVDATHPDILAIQELSAGLASGLQERIGQRYPYQLLRPLGIAGMGIFSKLPFSTLPFETQTTWVGQPQAIQLTLSNGQTVAFVNAHPMVTAPHTLNPMQFVQLVQQTYAERNRNMQEIARWWQAQPNAKVMACDCNMTDWQDAYRTLRQAGLQDTWRQIGYGMGASFPNTAAAIPFALPVLRLDYVFHDETHWQPISIEKRPWDGVSDHAAMFAILALKP
jgi:endonuclease/exonuclease/phosphatase (EEP) superfamily protein YafD